MRLSAILCLIPLIQAVNIVSSNDDGWAEANIRALYDALSASGHTVVLSAPAENQSGAGSKDAPPTNRTTPCEYNSCAANGGPFGHENRNPFLNWVNSYPVTSMKYGITKFMPTLLNGKKPDLAVAGPNVGPNMGLALDVSGTVGAATYAASQERIPAIAFSGYGSPTAWNATRPLSSKVYAEAATRLTDHLVAAGIPFLPDDIWLNVNFPRINQSTCSSVYEVNFVLTRLHDAVPLVTPDDVETCGSKRLPTETSIAMRNGCYASVSVGTAADKIDANALAQGEVLKKLNDLLTCISSI